eukprot:CAMPEP_0174698320 /NCGR_PEP_ID=MMETSP1094-20130205/3940_1 /TAXON_ID=156173 /ORGANISM="Chrysochromulina brevifilum, Strain UTEX LB 985" /LENGTH=284 /DNA_ID=CAMNT_0015895463 /DNA_START=71 /DNA_END=926 /DNA_ORIENTATION=+
MPPKRKASGSKAKAPAAKKQATSPEAAPAPAQASSPAKAAKPLSKLTPSDVWASPEYVHDQKMRQDGYSALCKLLSLEEMSFEYIYLSFCLSGRRETVDDVMVVCSSKHHLQVTIDSLGCRTMADVPARLQQKCAALRVDYGSGFTSLFRWLFEIGKALTALAREVDVTALRTVPVTEGLGLMDTVLSSWRLMPQLKDFFANKYAQPFSKDLWMQIGRFVNMTQTGRISADLSNYDDDDTGGGSAWPSAIDEFVEFVQAKMPRKALQRAVQAAAPGLGPQHRDY